MPAPTRPPSKSPYQAFNELYAAGAAQRVYERYTTAVQHDGAGVTVNIDVGHTRVGADIRWYGCVVMERGRQINLKGGSLPAATKRWDRVLQQQVVAQALALPAAFVLGAGGESESLF